MSSLTRSSTTAARIPCQRLSASKRSTMMAVSTGTKAASWKSKTTAAMTGRDRAYATDTRYAGASPSRRLV